MHDLPIWLTNPDPNIFMSNRYVVLDVETTNKDKGNACNTDNRLVLASWKCGWEDTASSNYDNEYKQGDLLSDIEEADFIVAHNAKFEIKWLHRMGADISKILPYCTMIGQYVIAGNRKWKLDLGTISQTYGYGGKDPFVDICMKGGVCPSDMPRSLLTGRCDKDIYQTEQIFLRQRVILQRDGLLPCFHTRCMFTPVLADMEMAGMYLDKDRVILEYNELCAAHARLTAEMDEFSGGVNPRSPKQMQEFIYDTLKFKAKKYRGQEQRGTDQASIAALKPKTKKQHKFVALKKEYAKVNALLTKTVQFMMGVCEEQDSTFYAQFNQCVTKTHRLSSSGLPVKFNMYDKAKSVQFQNFPRQYKGMFKARLDGWLMGEIDGAQLEFRVAAFCGQDKQAKEDIRSGADVHQFTADTITAAGQTTDRQGAKAHTFKPLYGGQSGTEAEKAYYEAFKVKYSGVAETQRGWIDEVVRTKKLTLASGLILYWPTARLQGSGYVTDSTQICNAPVQSLATAEMMPIAITYMWHRMKAAVMQSFLVNTIHDSAIAEIHPEETELFAEVGVQAFTRDTYRYMNIMYGLDWNIPMGAGVKIGEHWGEGEEEVYTVDPEEIDERT